MSSENAHRTRSLALALGAIGVAFGDIGTSPLYALRECMHALGGEHVPTGPEVMGILSLILWALILVVCGKYLALVLRADNRGEGGILALLALAVGERPGQTRSHATLVTVGIIGAALLYGDGIITPCITVLSAVEGLKVATDVFDPWIVPLSIVILILLFYFQRMGTATVGRVFGPVMIVWFVTLTALGIRGILMWPAILTAINPLHGVAFLMAHAKVGFIVIGAVFLVVTGSESLYADLGHFGATPIRRGWFLLVFPSLALNYLGQGALVLAHPDAAAHNPFFALAPAWGIYPFVALSTAASVIASQALITGAFSITTQAIQLGYLPRMEIRHTSATERGQIYLPFVSGMLMTGCIATVASFGTSSRLAAAYGIAVTLTMLVTTLLFYAVARRRWAWPLWKAGTVCLFFLTVELFFFSANALKIAHGGWFPLAIATGLFTIMVTWKSGRQRLHDELAPKMLPLEDLLKEVKRGNIHRAPGTAVYLVGKATGTPLSLLHNLKLNRVLHERVILLTMVTTEDPRVDPARRVVVTSLDAGFHRVVASYGFMETPDIREVLGACGPLGLELRPEGATFILSRETMVLSPTSRWPRWRSRLFAFLSRNAQSPSAFFGLPPNRVVELGMQIGI